MTPNRHPLNDNKICLFFFQYKVFATNQPELYRPADNDDDDSGAANITAKEIEQEAKEVRKNPCRRSRMKIDLSRQVVRCKKANQ